MKRYVVGFLFTPDKQKVVLIKKTKPEWQKGCWNGVGGKLEPGELWEDAMCREFFEETGVKVSGWGWRHTVTLYNEGFECRFFHAFSPEAEKVRTQEEEEVALLEMRDVICGYVPVISNLYWLLPLQLDPGLHFPIAPIKDGFPEGQSNG